MTTPIVDFVKAYAESKKIRLHMPGHKGIEYLGPEKYDITEIDGADVLYCADGIIKQSEDNAGKIFGTAKTLYSTEGSSLAIRAMLYLVKLYGISMGKKSVIAAARNAHKTFMTACALLDIEVDWIFSENCENIISCDISAELLEKYFLSTKEKPVAVFITSPDYLGNMVDIRDLGEVCRKHGVLLIVDNAHGAYLKFLTESLHPISLGADMCCDSAHKTLPSLTGGAYLHISHKAPTLFEEQAETAMSLFASTSPSYLILQSLDMVNKHLNYVYKKKLLNIVNRVNELKQKLKAAGYKLMGNEPLKLSIASKCYGYTGKELADILWQNGIVCEFSDPDFVVMMLTPELDENDIEKTERVLLSIPKKEIITQRPPILSKKEKILSLKDAVFAPSDEIDIEKSCGRVLSSAAVSCPPAIPIIICGEKIDQNAIQCFKYYGIKKCRVLKKQME